MLGWTLEEMLTQTLEAMKASKDTIEAAVNELYPEA